MLSCRAAEIRLASSDEKSVAYEIVQEYYAALNVVQREAFVEFKSEYFRPGAGFWLARLDSRIIGCIALRRLSLPSSAEIKRMYVRTEARGQGIAQQLLDTVQTFARDAGYEWLYLDTTSEMETAARLYERNGFQHCSRYNDNTQATIFMKKSLKSL